jgi:NitT/TauT family transport system ATP-binding protein
MVSHDIKEVVYMADRIVVLSSHPGRVRTIVENRLPRPRDTRSRAFEDLVDYLHEIITGAEMPDAPATVTTRTTRLEPLPVTTTSEVIGLLEFLDSKGGADDIFDVAAATDHEFGRMMAITKAAEMLDFVDTPKQDIVLTAEGRRVVQAETEQRKAIWRERLLDLRLFQDVHALLQREGGEVNGDIVREMSIMELPRENYEEMFETMVRWARFGNLFAYEDDADRLSLQ